MKKSLAVAGLALLAGAVWASDWNIGGGELYLEGQLQADKLIIENGAWLRGNGTLVGDLTARGHISPGGPAADNVGTQRVRGAAAFESGSRFHTYATSHSGLDRLEATGTVSGVCGVQMTNAPGAVPVNAIVIRGNTASAFGSFTTASAWNWRLGTTGTVDLILTSLRGDSDSNGLPDWWELAYFSVRTGTPPAGDFDNDFYNNLSEYLANTLPKDSNSLLMLTRIAKSPGGSEVQWMTTPGRKYELLVATNLPLLQWTTSAVLTAYSQPLQTWTDAVPAAQQSFGVRVQENGP